MKPHEIAAGAVVALGAVWLLSRKTTSSMCPAPTRAFLSEVDDYAPYAPVTSCDPTPKPGVIEFRNWVLENLGGGDLGISRACSSDADAASRHHEGRAWDWKPPTSELATRFVECLTSPDENGNADAWARRAGLRVIIWNRKIWTTGTKRWRPYTGASPHTDHVHFTFGWPGANGLTSWFKEVADTAPQLGAMRLAALDGGDATPTASMWGVPGLKAGTDNAFRRELIEVGRRLGLDPNLLACVMSFETAHTFDPTIRPYPGGAVGLIQFTDPWAKRITGHDKEQIAKMSQMQQLALVEKWFAAVPPSRIKRPQDYYFAVFAPACIGRSGDFAPYVSPAPSYAHNRGMDADGDGRITCDEIARKFLGLVSRAKAATRIGVFDDERSRLGPALVALIGAGVIYGACA